MTYLNYAFMIKFRFSSILFCPNISAGFEEATTTAQKMTFSMKDFFSDCDQSHRKLWIWSHLLKKPLMENFIFCAVDAQEFPANDNSN